MREQTVPDIDERLTCHLSGEGALDWLASRDSHLPNEVQILEESAESIRHGCE